MRTHNLEILSGAVLLKLYNYALKYRKRLGASQICSLFDIQVAELFVEKALDRLETNGLIYGSHSSLGSEYEIEGAGIEYVQEQLSKETSNIAQFEKFGDEWLQDAQVAYTGRGSLPQPKFTEFRDELVIALYHKSNEEGLEIYNLKPLADENQLAYRDGWIREFENFLDEHGYALVRKVMGGDEVCAAQLNASGLEYAEELITQSEGAEQADAQRPIPASDRYVEIDHNSPEFKDAETKVETATEAIRGFNELTDYDKDQIVSELTIGQQLFKSAKIRVGAVIAMVLTPLYTVYHDTAAEALRPVVQAAVDAVKVWLGL